MSKELNAIARAAGFAPFDFDGHYSGSLSAAAERLTEGKTHYFDAGTRRYFGSSVSKLRSIGNGVALAAIERVSIDSNHSAKGYRVVVIDLEGSVINDRVSVDSAHKTKRAAEKEFETVCAALDPVAILKNAMIEKRKNMRRDIDAIDSVISKL